MNARWRDGIQYDTRASQPAASAVDVGSLYYVTDEYVLERGNGTTWQQVAVGTTAGLDFGEAGDIVTQAFGDSPAAGATGEVADTGHTHGMMADPTTAHVAAGDPHAQYVKEAEFTAADTVLLGTGAGTLTTLLHKFDGTAAPTADEDSGDGFAVGSIWIDVTGDSVYICVDATAAAAVWQEVGAGGGGGGAVATDAIWDAKGDIAVGTGPDAAIKRSVGSDGQVLTADSAEADGVKWATPSGGGSAAPGLDVYLYDNFS